MTFSCWVKIHSFDRWLSSLILTENYDKNELHWQLSDTGEIILGAHSYGNTFFKTGDKPKDLGRWLHLTTVFAPRKGKIVHYLDGKEIHRRSITKGSKVVMGKSDIGNWTSTTGNSHALRSLNGMIDEFIIFSSALSDGEVEEIYEKEDLELSSLKIFIYEVTGTALEIFIFIDNQAAWVSSTLINFDFSGKLISHFLSIMRHEIRVLYTAA